MRSKSQRHEDLRRAERVSVVDIGSDTSMPRARSQSHYAAGCVLHYIDCRDGTHRAAAAPGRVQLEETTIARIHAAMKAGTHLPWTRRTVPRANRGVRQGRPGDQRHRPRQSARCRGQAGWTAEQNRERSPDPSTAFQPSSRTTSRPSDCRAQRARYRSRDSCRTAMHSR